MAEKISYENWLSSARKWVKNVKKVQDEELFSNDWGFDNLAVVKRCGYCRELKGCGQCSLFEKRMESMAICYSHLTALTHFSMFVKEMRKKQPNFEIALQECQIVLNAILEDCPDKNRAVQDGIVFG